MKHAILKPFALLLALFGLPAAAEPLSLDFNLAAPNANQNTVPISVTASFDTGFPFGVVSASDSASSTVSGNALVDLDVSFDSNGNPTTLNTIAFIGGRVQIDDDLSLELSFAFGLASVDIDTAGLAGRLFTPGGPAPINGGTFGLTPHELSINEGSLTAVGGGLADGINETFDFAAEPLTAGLEGSSAISVALDHIVDGVGFYTAAITAPFTFSQTIDIDADTSASVATSGTLVAEAGFTRQLLDPEDLDGDADVDDADFGLFFAAFSGPGVQTSNPAADLDGDNDTDDADFGLAFAAFTGPGAAASVPEPASLTLVASAGLCLLRRRPIV